MKLDAPKTHYELDCIQPDFLLLKVGSSVSTWGDCILAWMTFSFVAFFLSFCLQALSRGLIMWDSVEPAQEWIDGHIPEVDISN